MESSSIFETVVEEQLHRGWMPEELRAAASSFCAGYVLALQPHKIPFLPWVKQFLKLLKQQHDSPFTFQPYHRRIRHPYDYYAFGADFLRPLVDKKSSTIVGEDRIQEVLTHLKNGDNVVFFANHQIEADPQALTILLDEKYPHFAEEMIFVAGERVITDPVAIPFSMGRNLLCIYSKRYIDHPPEKKREKQHHNQKTMELMSDLLREGGKAIYVAPSGGRDRKNSQGVVEVAPFDPQSIEMFYLMAKKSQTATYFYPMALATHHLLPPPETIRLRLGEPRFVQRGAIHLAVGACIDMNYFPGYDLLDRRARRQARASYIWQLVCSDYAKLGV